MSQPKSTVGSSYRGQGDAKSFAKSISMRTAKFQMDTSRQKNQRAAQDEYLGTPPPAKDLFQSRLVLPGKHLLPRGMDEPGTFDNIRKAYKAYITNVKPNVLDVRSNSILHLQQAIKAINWAIHDLRLSNESPPIRFIVQEPTRAAADSLIKFQPPSRPCFLSRGPEIKDIAPSMGKHLKKMSADMTSAASLMMTLNKNLTMRIKFGSLAIRQRKKGTPDEISFDNYVEMMNIYSKRGGASLDTKFADTGIAEDVIRYLINSERGICTSPNYITQTGEIVVVANGLEIKSDIVNSAGKFAQLSKARAICPEAWSPLHWVIAAPDMAHDWSLTVDSWDKVSQVPAGFEHLEQRLTLIDDNREMVAPWSFSIPTLNTNKLYSLESEIKEIRLKNSVLIPYKDTPYVIEISITTAWRGCRTTDEPTVSYGIELYGVHWDECINHASAGERRKDWGEGLINVWPGNDPSLEVRFGDFVRTVLEVQSLLENFGSKD